jgi:hypothetical protein
MQLNMKNAIPFSSESWIRERIKINSNLIILELDAGTEITKVFTDCCKSVRLNIDKSILVNGFQGSLECGLDEIDLRIQDLI